MNLPTFSSLLKSSQFWKILSIVVGLGAVTSGAFAAYKHYTNLLEELTIKSQTLFVVQAETKLKDEKLKLLERDLIDSRRDRNAYIDLVSRLSVERERVTKTFIREQSGKKSMRELSLKRTRLVEKAINNGTQKTFRCIELITGKEEAPNEIDSLTNCLARIE